jgi:hypothetical protein
MSKVIKTNIVTSFTDWLKYNFFIKKFNTPAGWIVMALLGIGLAFSGTIDSRLPILITVGVAGICTVITAISAIWPDSHPYYIGPGYFA